MREPEDSRPGDGHLGRVPLLSTLILAPENEVEVIKEATKKVR